MTRDRREPCSELDCGLPAKGKGLCNKHYLKAYRILNLEKSRQASREYQAANREQVLAYKRWYRSVNREKLREKNRIYKAKNREKSRQDTRIRHARLVKNGVYTVTAKDLAALKRKPCYLCGGKAETVDHRVPVARGGRHSIGNLEPCCRGCNFAKRDKLLVKYLADKRSSAADQGRGNLVARSFDG